MIKSLTINPDYKTLKRHEANYSWALKVPYLIANPTIEFDKGLNIIFGPNGCGKSTLTGLCAFLTASEQGGVTTYTKKWMHSLFDHLGICHNYPKLTDLIAQIKFDGLPTFYHNPRNTIGLSNGNAFDDDFFSIGLANLKLPDGSVGEVSRRKLNQFLSPMNAKELPTLVKGDEWMSRHESFKHDYAASMELLTATCEASNRTFILDEPEMGFSLLWQAEFWRNLVQLVAKHDRQIIVATHCPFALNIHGAHYIDMEPGYLEKCRAEFKKVF